MAQTTTYCCDLEIGPVASLNRLLGLITSMNPTAIKVLRRLGALDLGKMIAKGRLSVSGLKSREKILNVPTLIDRHFLAISQPQHPCRETLSTALSLLGERPAVIIETGSSAWGTNSTMLFDSYCYSFGGQCRSVDIRLEPLLTLQSLATSHTKLYCNDSVSFLNELSVENNKIDLLYLDSWDVNWDDPMPSAIHGLNEYLAATKNLKPGSLVLIDDTPKTVENIRAVQPLLAKPYEQFYERFGFAPGKGALIKQLIDTTGRGTVLAHEYQLLIRI